MAEKKELSMEMRVLVAFALSAVVLMLYPLLVRRVVPPPARPAPVQTERAAEEPAQPTRPEAPRRTGAAPPSTPAPASPQVALAKQASEEKETVVENDLYRVVFSNRGAVVKSWTLKHYKDSHGRPLELVNQPAALVLGYPLTTWVDDEALRQTLSNALFEVRATGRQAPATVRFEYGDGKIAARKEFRFEHGSYVARVSSQLDNGGNAVAHELAWRGSFGDQTVHQAHDTTSIVTATPANIEHLAYSKIKSESKLSGPFLYAGIEDLFFASIFMPPADAHSDASVQTVRIYRSDYRPQGAENTTALVGVGVGGVPENDFRVFVGPKAFDVLNGIYPVPGGEQRQRQGQPEVTLSQLLDFGWFSFIAKPLFLTLKWVYSRVVANYGWAIVLITVVINFALFPLKLKSMKSALKMQRVAPQVKAVQEKYKKLKFNDPRKQEQNKEVMELYKKHGINPLGGCLPMALQIPFFYAFYKVLSISIEMRHAPWILWIRDLSAKDPYYVLPIVMTVTMFLLQRMTPQTTTDPAQARMFMLMPLIFGFMFMQVSSGLVLYWLVGNIVGIAQQWYINKVGLAPAASRKPVLAGKKPA